MTTTAQTPRPAASPLLAWHKMSGPRKVSYGVFIGLIGAAAVMHLGPMLLAGLFSYLILDLSHRRLAQAMPATYARWTAFAIFIIAATALSGIFWEFFRQSIASLPRLTATALPKIAETASQYGIELPFETFTEIRESFLAYIRDNAVAVTRMTGLLTKRFFHVLVGVFVAVLCFFAETQRHEYGDSLYDFLRLEVHDRLRTFMLSFERVFGAQIVISGINTVVTALFLAVVGIPHLAFLVPATFVLGLLPLVGNILSNTLIVTSALTLSPRHAVFALAFLVIIHKAEYFLNSRIVGGSIDTPMWLTLLGIMVGEIVMGVPGIILAPALLHYARTELQALPAPK